MDQHKFSIFILTFWFLPLAFISIYYVIKTAEGKNQCCTNCLANPEPIFWTIRGCFLPSVQLKQHSLLSYAIKLWEVAKTQIYWSGEVAWSKIMCFSCKPEDPSLNLQNSYKKPGEVVTSAVLVWDEVGAEMSRFLERTGLPVQIIGKFKVQRFRCYRFPRHAQEKQAPFPPNTQPVSVFSQYPPNRQRYQYPSTGENQYTICDIYL